MDAPLAQAQYRRMKPVLVVSLSALLAGYAHAQPPAEDARLRAAESAVLAGICAHVRPGDALSPKCGLGPERARSSAEGLAAALATAGELAPEARRRALAEAVARYRAVEAARPRRKPAPTDSDRILIAPPGFGPDPTAPLE